MGIAWFDGESVPMEAVELRSGGLPLLAEDAPWPACPRCGAPMLFRAQIPLAMTSVVGPLDERVLSLFECRAGTDADPCDGAVALIAAGACTPRQPPSPLAFDVRLEDAGPDPARVAAIVARLGGDEACTLTPPQAIARAIPASMAEQTLRILSEAGARAVICANPQTTHPSVCGAVLVPFDDRTPGTTQTTLPPLSELVVDRRVTRARLRGLLGGAVAATSHECVCGHSTRTVVRLVAVADAEPPLGPAVAQLCLACGRAYYQRANTG